MQSRRIGLSSAFIPKVRVVPGRCRGYGAGWLNAHDKCVRGRELAVEFKKGLRREKENLFQMVYGPMSEQGPVESIKLRLCAKLSLKRERG